MKYRVYRKITSIEYKDIEVENEIKTATYKTDSRSGWTITGSGYITDFLISTDLKREGRQDIFIERDIELTKKETQ